MNCSTHLHPKLAGSRRLKQWGASIRFYVGVWSVYGLAWVGQWYCIQHTICAICRNKHTAHGKQRISKCCLQYHYHSPSHLPTLPSPARHHFISDSLFSYCGLIVRIFFCGTASLHNGFLQGTVFLPNKKRSLRPVQACSGSPVLAFFLLSKKQCRP